MSVNIKYTLNVHTLNVFKFFEGKGQNM